MIPNTSISVGHVYINVYDVPVRSPMQLGVPREPYQCTQKSTTPGNAVSSHHLNTPLVLQQAVENTIVPMSNDSVIADIKPIHNTSIITSSTTTSTPKSTPRKQDRPQFIIPPRTKSEIGSDNKSNNSSWLSFFG